MLYSFCSSCKAKLALSILTPDRLHKAFIASSLDDTVNPILEDKVMALSNSIITWVRRFSYRSYTVAYAWAIAPCFPYSSALSKSSRSSFDQSCVADRVQNRWSGISISSMRSKARFNIFIAERCCKYFPLAVRWYNNHVAVGLSGQHPSCITFLKRAGSHQSECLCICGNHDLSSSIKPSASSCPYL